MNRKTLVFVTLQLLWVLLLTVLHLGVEHEKHNLRPKEEYIQRPARNLSSSGNFPFRRSLQKGKASHFLGSHFSFVGSQDFLGIDGADFLNSILNISSRYKSSLSMQENCMTQQSSFDCSKRLKACELFCPAAHSFRIWMVPKRNTNEKRNKASSGQIFVGQLCIIRHVEVCLSFQNESHACKLIRLPTRESLALTLKKHTQVLPWIRQLHSTCLPS